MLKGIPNILSPELLKILMEMGHGDELVIADGNFPAASHAQRLVRCDGQPAPPLLDAVLQLFPLDTFVKHPAALMAVVPGDDYHPDIWPVYKTLLQKHVPTFAGFEAMEPPILLRSRSQGLRHRGHGRSGPLCQPDPKERIIAVKSTMRSLKQLLPALLAVLLVAAFLGCNQKQDADATPDKHRVTIGISYQNLQNEFIINIQDAMRAEAKNWMLTWSKPTPRARPRIKSRKPKTSSPGAWTPSF